MTRETIDRSALRKLLDLIGGDPEDLEELLEEYRSTAPALASRISGAAEAGDLETLRIAAHTLKSNARDFGAMRLSSLCEALEQGCRSGAVDDRTSAAIAIVAEEAAARQALASVSTRDLIGWGAGR